MTEQEAIEVLSEIRSGYNCFDESERRFYEALSMAIEALSELDSNSTEVDRENDELKGILTPEERSEVLNAIDDALNGYQVDGYEDTDGMFFKVLISKVERGDSDE